MSIDLGSFESKKLNRYVKISVLLHVALFLAFTINATFFTEPPVEFEKAIRVDMVGLPDKPSAELAPAPAAKEFLKESLKETVKEPPKEPVKPEPSKPELVTKPIPPNPVAKTEVKPTKLPKVLPKIDTEAINLEKTKSKQKQALEKLKQLEALEEIQKDVETEGRKKTAQATAAAGAKYKGNVLAPGTELTGVNKLQADNYISDVHRHMIENWTLPEYLKNRKLRTDVLVRFDESGVILAKEVVKSSGNPTFDEFVLAAIQKSSPVPAPPAKFVRLSSVQGFLFRFSHDF